MDRDDIGHFDKIIIHQKNNDLEQIFNAYKQYFNERDFSKALDILDVMIDMIDMIGMIKRSYLLESVIEHLFKNYIQHINPKYPRSYMSYYSYLHRSRIIYMTNKCIKKYVKLHGGCIYFLHIGNPKLYEDMLKFYIKYGYYDAVTHQLVDVCVNIDKIDKFLSDSCNVILKRHKLRNVILLQRFIKNEGELSANLEMTHILCKFLFG